MSLFQQHMPEEARKLFNQAEAQMPTLPSHETEPLVDGKSASHDDPIRRLAYQQAKSLIERPSAPAAEPTAPR